MALQKLVAAAVVDTLGESYLSLHSERLKQSQLLHQAQEVLVVVVPAAVVPQFSALFLLRSEVAVVVAVILAQEEEAVADL